MLNGLRVKKPSLLPSQSSRGAVTISEGLALGASGVTWKVRKLFPDVAFHFGQWQ
jgi:hypothetical protein